VGTGFLTSVGQSGLTGQLIVVVLLLVSVYSWAIIFHKHGSIRRAKRRSELFLEEFRADPDGMIAHYADRRRFASSPFASVLEAGLAELALIMGARTRSAGAPRLSAVQVDGIERSLERHLIVLATTAGASPFVGLFGTVWGIMQAFAAMSVTGSASISSVAPGVSAALTTTVAGLAVAIPALVGYNYLMNRVRVLTIQMENFSSEVISTVERNYGSH
jgi:biopolymer transport protein TolQ